MSIVALKSDYIISANKAYANLEESESLFEEEVYVLSYIKCALLREEEIDDYYINGIYVSVYDTNNGYELCFNGYKLDIEIYDKQIIDINLRS